MNKILGAAAASAALLIPGLAFAQDYAYVDATGAVRTVDAVSADAALMTAPNIGLHSGVMLMSADDSDVVGDSVAGV